MAEVKYTVVGEARFEQLERELVRAEQKLDNLQQKARRAQGAAADAAATGDLSERMAGRTFLERLRPGDVSADDAARRARMNDAERSRDMFRALHAMADARDAAADPRPASGSAASFGLMTNEQLALKNQRLLANYKPNPTAPEAGSPLSARPPSVAELAGRAAMEAGGWEALAEEQRAKRVADQVAADALKAQASRPSDFVQPLGKYGPHRFGERIGDERRAFEARQRAREAAPLERVAPPAAPPAPPAPPRPPGGGGAAPVPPLPSGAAQAIDGVAASMRLVQIAAIPAAFAVYAYAEGMRKQTEEAMAANLKFDVVERRLNVSTGEAGPTDGSTSRRILGLARTFAVDSDYAAQIVDTAVKSGMSRQDALGAGGAAYLRVATALNASRPGKDQVDPAKLPSIIQSMLRAEGKPVTPENIERVGSYVRAAYEGELELKDLEFIGKNLAGYRSSNVSTVESIALASTLRDIGMPAGESSIAVRNSLARSVGAKASPAKVKALANIGLRPEDIDLQGEDVATVLDRLAAAKDRSDPVTFKTSMLKLYEERGAPAMEALLVPENRQRLRKYVDSIRATPSLDKYVELGTSGAAASAQRDEVSMEAVALSDKPLVRYQQLIGKADVLNRERGVPRGIQDIDTWLLQTLGYFLGPSLAESAAGFSPEVYDRFERDSKGAVSRGKDPLDLLDKIERNTRPKPEPAMPKAKAKPGADEE